MKRVVITGASRGIGLELARQHLLAGDRVLATCRAPSRAEALSKLVAAHPDRAKVVPLDVADGKSIGAAASEAKAFLGAVDRLWSNAGVYPGSPGTAVTEQHLGDLTAPGGLEILHVNAVGAVLVAQAFLPLLRAGSAPKLAAISSGYGSVSENQGTPYWYGASKAALNMLHRSLAFDPAARGVTVLILSPGWTSTDMGGPHAPDPLGPVVEGLRRVVDGAGRAEHGAFLDWRGEEVPW